MARNDFASEVTACSVDPAKVDPLQKKRLVTFVNHFVASTVDFLDKFARDAECKMEALELRMARMEAAVAMVENKLESVPKLKSDAAID